jgi:hypothetical protein
MIDRVNPLCSVAFHIAGLGMEAVDATDIHLDLPIAGSVAILATPAQADYIGGTRRFLRQFPAFGIRK